MTARTGSIVGSVIGNLQFGEAVRKVKSIMIETPATADQTNTVVVTYSKYGITTVLAVQGWKHTTDNSVCVAEDPTTSVTTSVMTITVPAGTDDDKRLYQLFYI